MTYPISAGVYPREVDQSFIVPAAANSIGGIVINSDRGPAGALTLITSNKQFIDTFGKPAIDKPSTQAALAFLQKANRLWVVRAINDAAAASYVAMDSQATPVATFTVYAANEGAWGNNLTIDITAAVAGVFKIAVYDSAVKVEEFSVAKTQILDGYGKSLYLEDVINGVSQYIKVVDDITNVNVPAAVAATALTGGSNDTVVPTDAQVDAGWDLFAVKENVEVSLLINGGWTSTTVQQHMITIAEARKDCFAILDMPSASQTSVATMVTYNDTTLNANTSFAAMYAPDVKIYDQYNDKIMYVPPSGHVAGVYAYSASVSEVWNAPAGVRRGLMNVLGTRLTFSEGDRDTLYTSNINPIQTFTGEGVQVYGQKTLQRQASALDRVNVRMLMITIEKALARSLRPFVFEFNDTFTRENITSIVSNYLEDIKTRRGVYDYQAICDESNNTPTVIDANQLILDVYIKPTRVAEFIRLNAVITATGASFTAG